jgi:RimJ/RimL family protein N-acetyltransferase
MGASDEWPCGALTLGVPSRAIELRPASDADAVVMGRIVHDLLPAHERHFTPRLSARRGAVAEETAENFRARTAENRAAMSAEAWSVPFAVVLDGEVVGMQSTMADDFPLARSVRTGSFLDAAVRGRSVGPLARALVIEFCVTVLGAREMLTGHMTANHASRRVSERLGYVPIGEEQHEFDGVTYTSHLLRLSAQDWQARRRRPLVPGVTIADLQIDGADSWPGLTHSD